MLLFQKITCELRPFLYFFPYLASSFLASEGVSKDGTWTWDRRNVTKRPLLKIASDNSMWFATITF